MKNKGLKKLVTIFLSIILFIPVNVQAAGNFYIEYNTKKSTRVYTENSHEVYNMSGRKYFKGYEEGDKVFLDDGHNRRYVYKKDTVYVYRIYEALGANMRDKNGNLVGYIYENTLISAVDKGDYLEFDYEGKTVTIPKIYSYRLGDYDQKYWIHISKGANIRNSGGKKIGYLIPGDEINGIGYRDYVHFIYKGQHAKIYDKNLIRVDREVYSEYRSYGANVRDVETNKIVKYIPKGEIFDGHYKGDGYIYLDDNKSTLRVSQDFAVLNKSVGRFRSKGANIRDANGKKIGYIKPLEDFYGVVERGRIVLLDRPVKSIVAYSAADEYDSDSFSRSLGGNIRNMKGRKIGYLPKGKVIFGIGKRDYVEFVYKGQKARVSKTRLDIGISPTFVYKSKGANVRSSSGRKVKYLPKGTIFTSPSMPDNRGDYISYSYDFMMSGGIHKNYVEFLRVE